MNGLFRSPFGALFARPWVDGAGLAGLKRWYFPVSRLWAAANAAGTDSARFILEIGAPLSRLWSADRLVRALDRTARARDAALVARARWEEGLFAGAGVGDPAALEHRRRLSATRHLAARALFSAQVLIDRPPLAHWQIPSPRAMRDELDAAGRDPCGLYVGPFDIATVEQSAMFDVDGVRQYWLRAPTPAGRLKRWPGSRTLYARVVEPLDRSAKAPTLIFGGGFGLELDLLAGGVDPDRRLAELGWRVVTVISPFHGLRAETDRYGGEPFIATAPAGTIDLITGQAIETAMLIAWARARFGGKVALAGISMTSFVAQQAASHCHAWPGESRPDAVLLISHSGRMEEVAFGGALSAALGLDRELRAAGWSTEDLLRVSHLLDPTDKPAVPPGRIVSVLGSSDRWLPFKDGLAVARRWMLPEANVFRYPVGHLGMPVQLMRAPEPFGQLRRVLEQA